MVTNVCFVLPEICNGQRRSYLRLYLWIAWKKVGRESCLKNLTIAWVCSSLITHFLFKKQLSRKRSFKVITHKDYEFGFVPYFKVTGATWCLNEHLVEWVFYGRNLVFWRWFLFGKVVIYSFVEMISYDAACSKAISLQKYVPLVWIFSFLFIFLARFYKYMKKHPWFDLMLPVSQEVMKPSAKFDFLELRICVSI